MGLLDNFGGNLDDPKTQAMLALGLGLLNSRGNFGQGLGQAGTQALGAYGDARKAQQQQAMQQQQMKAQEQAMQSGVIQQQLMQQQVQEAQRAAAERARQQQFLQGLQDPRQAAMAGGGGPTQANAARIDPSQRMMFDAVKAGVVPLQSYITSMQKDDSPLTVKEGETLIDRKTYAPVFKGAMKEDDFVKNMRASGIDPQSPQGQGLMRQWLQKQSTHTPPVNVSVSMDKGFGEAFAKDAAGSLATSRDKAQGAARTIQTLDRIDSAIGGGSVVSGPGATPEMVLRQVGEKLGVTGKSNAETLKRTRDVIQGAASLAVDGAAMLAGQGQITEGERALVAKAAGGDITTLTGPEIGQLSKTLRKINGGVISAHQDRLKKVDPKFAPFVPFYQVDAPPAAAGPSVDDLLKKYGN
jgi:hypothetical protein